MKPEELIRRYLLGEATQPEVEQLDRLLADDPTLRAKFVFEVQTDAGLREVAFEQMSQPALSGRQQHATYSQTFMWVAIAASIILVTGFIWTQRARDISVAILETSENAAWESSLPTTPGSKLANGLLKLKSGVATIKFNSGASVVLESPAALELVTPMRGKLLTGAAVIDVPDEAIGFVMETPEGYAIDYGTRFAVRVDQNKQTSNFEIIEGEIAVHHPETGKEVRLTGQGKAATVFGQELVVTDHELQEDVDTQADVDQRSVNVLRVGTNGRSGSALRRNKRKFIDPDVLSVKRTETGKWDYRSFFAFDCSEIEFSRVEAARLRLNLVPSTRGLASRLPKTSRFAVYGLTNPAKADWEIDCLWEDAPGPEDGVRLGSFEIPRSRQRGSFGIQTAELLDFVKKHEDRQVTLILVRETTQIEGTGPVLTHMFASDSHPESVGPMLEFSFVE